MDEISLALIVIIFSIIFFFIYKRCQRKRRDILLAGLCHSGKTVVFSQLVHGKCVQTFTSMKENIADYVVNNDKLRVVDVPGHERLRSKYLETYCNNAKGIVFVLDSSTVNNDVKDVADFLFALLCQSLQNNIKNILILCNKQDLKEAVGIEYIKELLENEINTVRFTKSKQLDSVYSNSKKIELLSESESSFSFENLNIKIEFVKSSVGEGKGNVDIASLKDWLAVMT